MSRTDHRPHIAPAASTRAASERPFWASVLRALREARGVTQEGWAAQLGIARSTLLRWERGEVAPDARAEDALVALCTEKGLCRTYDRGPLAGVTVSPAWLRDLLAAARAGLKAGGNAHAHAVPTSPLHGAGGAGGLVDEQSPDRMTRDRMPLLFPCTAFVGRTAELHRLCLGFDAAAAGESALAFVVGEPGIGKTSLCGQLAAHAVARDGRILIGHCYEAGSLSLPYLPFVEALRGYVLDRERESLRRELGAHAPDVARIVPELREILSVEPGPATDPETDRYRLFQAVTSFLRAIAGSRPLLLVLEDLHDADRGTLDLLLHLARSLSPAGARADPASGTRLLVVGTYRDVEVDRAHPLAGALAELRRAAPVGRVRLGGLTVEETGQVVHAVAGEAVSPTVAEAVHRQTEGNPLFVQEVARFLVEEGLTAGTKGRTDSLPLALRIPEGLRDVIGKRLSRLSAECNRVLGVAAVVGREFDLTTLRTVAGLADERLDGALEEAGRAGVLEEQERPGAVRFRFVHAFFRQMLYEELSAPRRLRLHQQVARALEAQHAARLPEHAAELADHFAHSTDPADLARAVEYGELAGHRAMAVFAYGEAARLLEQAVEVQEILDPDDAARRCDLLLALGQALIPAGEARRAIDDAAPRALALAEGLADEQRAAHACLLALDGLSQYGQASAYRAPGYQRWVDEAVRYARAGSADFTNARLSLANSLRAAGQLERARSLHLDALSLARTLDDAGVLFRAAFGLLNGFSTAPQHLDEQLELAAEFAARPRAGVSAALLGQLLWFIGVVYLARGDRERAGVLWREVEELAARTQDSTVILHHRVTAPLVDTLDGKLEAAVEAAASLRAWAEAAGLRDAGQVLARSVARRPLLDLGRAEEAVAMYEVPRAPGGVGELWYVELARGACLAHASRTAEASDVLDRYLAAHDVASDRDETPLIFLLNLLEIAVLLGDCAVAAKLSARLAPLVQLATADWYATAPARHLGAAAVLLGEPERAHGFYQQALEAASRIRCRPEITLTHLQLAELLLEHYPSERAEAREHLEMAIHELRDMRMQPALERALRLQERALTEP